MSSLVRADALLPVPARGVALGRKAVHLCARMRKCVRISLGTRSRPQPLPPTVYAIPASPCPQTRSIARLHRCCSRYRPPPPTQARGCLLVLPALQATTSASPRLHTLWNHLLPFLLPGFRPHKVRRLQDMGQWWWVLQDGMVAGVACWKRGKALTYAQAAHRVTSVILVTTAHCFHATALPLLPVTILNSFTSVTLNAGKARYAGPAAPLHPFMNATSKASKRCILETEVQYKQAFDTQSNLPAQTGSNQIQAKHADSLMIMAPHTVRSADPFVGVA
eukprot:308811-Pelagomonas_calceolata.AAC.3